MRRWIKSDRALSGRSRRSKADAGRAAQVPKGLVLSAALRPQDSPGISPTKCHYWVWFIKSLDEGADVILPREPLNKSKKWHQVTCY